MNNRNTIHVLIETTTPQHTAYPDNSVKLPDGGRVALTNKKQVRGVDVPCHPANGIRGQLRRFAADRIVNVISDTQERIPASIYRGLKSGASSGRPDKAKNSIEELVRVSNHPYMGLFGGGARIFPSKYQVSDINIVCNHTVEAYTVNAPKSFIEEELAMQTYVKDDNTLPLKPYMYLERHFFTRVDDFRRELDLVQLDRSIEDGLKGVDALLEEDNKNTAARGKADSEDKKETTGTLILNETIKSGVPMHFRIDVSPDITSEQLGVLFLSLQDLFNDNYIGGWGRAGYGQYRVKAVQLNHDDEVIKQNDSFYNDESGSFEFGEQFKSLIDDGMTAINNINAAEIKSFFENIEG